MTNAQPTLFEQPLARNADAVTSFEAADDLQRSGRWRKQVWRVFYALRECQGVTSSELSEKLDFADRYTCSRRLGDLRRMGLVCNGAKRQCHVSGKKCLSWYVASNWARRASQRPAGTPRRQPETTAPIRPASNASATPDAPEPSRLQRDASGMLSVEDRRRLRERLTAAGDPKTRRFLQGLGGVE